MEPLIGEEEEDMMESMKVEKSRSQQNADRNNMIFKPSDLSKK